MHRKAPKLRKAKGIIAKILEEMFAAETTCYYCRCQICLPTNERRYINTATIDHKTPKSRGGHKTSRRNLVLCCQACNHAKGNRTEVEYKAYLIGLQEIDANVKNLFPSASDGSVAAKQGFAV
jgi:5-methylcytosine-specific restriction endonuclease McrA